MQIGVKSVEATVPEDPYQFDQQLHDQLLKANNESTVQRIKWAGAYNSKKPEPVWPPTPTTIYGKFSFWDGFHGPTDYEGVVVSEE